MIIRGLVLAALVAASSAVRASDEGASFRIEAPALAPASHVPERFAFCEPDGSGRAKAAPDISPAVRWSGAPVGTRSFAVTMRDPDVPVDAADVNVDGRTIAATVPRRTFYHWLLVDVPSGATALEEGADSRGITPHGKSSTGATIGRRGVNDYTAFLASDPTMEGTYAGYDGPCPPWNDALVHRYELTVHALDVERLPLPALFDGRSFERAIDGHVLARATLTRTYATARPAAADRRER